MAVGNTLTLSPRTVNETRAQFAYGDLKALPTDPIGPAVSIAGVASFGTLVGQPDRPRQRMYRGRQQPVASGRRARAAGRRGLALQRRHHHVSARRSAAATRSRRWRTSSPASTTTPASRRRSATASSSQTNPNVGLYAQDEWKVQLAADAERRPALRPAVPRDDRHRHRTTSRRASASPGRRSTSRRTVVRAQRRPLLRPRAAARGRQRAAVGRQHDRPRAAAADQRQPVAGAGRRAGVPEHPAARRAVASRSST